MHKIRIHNISDRFLIWLIFQGHRGQSSCWPLFRVRSLIPKASKMYKSYLQGWCIRWQRWMHEIRIHNISDGFLIWPIFQGHRGQSSCWPLFRVRSITSKRIKIFPSYILGWCVTWQRCVARKKRPDPILGFVTRGTKSKTEKVL